jgi:hypothetical protein
LKLDDFEVQESSNLKFPGKASCWNKKVLSKIVRFHWA